jgi:hypothetical protein
LAGIAGSAVTIPVVYLQRDIHGLLYGNILSIGLATIFTYCREVPVDQRCFHRPVVRKGGTK